VAVKGLGKALGAVKDEFSDSVESLVNAFGIRRGRPEGPEYVTPPDPSPEELMEAQKEASKPVSEGGLGLPPENTPLDRAQAQGYKIPVYHGAEDDTLRSVDPMYGKDPRTSGRGFFGAMDPPEVAETYATPRSGEKGVVFPLLMRDDALASVKDASSPAKIGRVDFGGQNFDDAEDAILTLPDGTELTVAEDYRLGSLSTDELVDIAKEYDLDGIEAINIIDRGPRTYPGTREALQEADYGTSGGTEAITFSEGLLRAPNAAFNPAKRGSPSLTAGLSGTAIALGLVATPEEAEAAYIPLKAFAEGSEAAQALFKKAQKRIAEGADTRPNGELYNEMGVYRSEDGDFKVDVAELRARDVEKMQGLQQFAEDIDFYLSTNIRRKKKLEYPITRYLPEDSPIFENFPELKEVKVSLRPQPKNSNYLGEYNPNTKEVIVYADNDPTIDYSQFEDERAKKILNSFNTLFHEFQHYIQDVKKAANTGYNTVASLVATRGFREDYKDAVDALKTMQPGDIGYDQFKNKVDSVFGMVQKSLSAKPKSKDAPSPRDEFLAADFDEKLKKVEDVFNTFEKGSTDTDELIQSSQLGHNIYIRELGEAEARSTGLKALIPEGSDRKAIGVFYPTSDGKQIALRAEDVSLYNQLDPSHVLVRGVPAYEDFTDMGKLYFPESVMGQEALEPEIVKQAKKRSGDGGKGTAAVVAGGTAAGLASPPSEAFVEGVGEATGLFEDGSPTPSLFDVEGVSDELGITNTFLLDLLVPRTKPYDLISNIPGVGETMMAADVAQGLGSPDAETPDEFTDTPRDVAGMRQGGGIETEAGLEMEEKNPNKPIPKKADINKDGEIQGWEKARHEAIQETEKKTQMAMGGMMGMMADPFAPFQVTVDIDEESGNEVPAGSKEEEVRDDIPAMLSEGEYVVPADVVRYHGLKTFEELRCEAKHALGLMAMHDRISYVDDDTKEPVDYDIEEKDLPKVEKAEVEVVEAAEGTDVQPATDPTTFYQLQYKTDPVTGQVRIVYVDPMTGQEVKEEEYEQERASRFAPQTVLQREGLMGTEEEEAEEEECPEGYVKDPETGVCTPQTIIEGRQFVDTGGDGPDNDEGPSTDPSQGMSQDEINAALGAAVGYDPISAPEIPGTLGLVAKAIEFGVNGIKQYNAMNAVRKGENLGVTPSGEYGGWRSNLGPNATAAVAATENAAADVASGKTGLQGSQFGSVAEANTVANSGWGSDAHFDAIDNQFGGLSETRGGGTATPETGPTSGTSPGRPGGEAGERDGSDSTGSESTGGSNPAGDVDSGPGSGFGYAKGGMPTRKVKPRVAMMNYKGNK